MEDPINTYFQIELRNKPVEHTIVDKENQVIKKIMIQKLSEEESETVIEAIKILEVSEKATKFMEGRKYPTINYSTYAFEKLMSTAIEYKETARFDCNKK